MQPTRCLAYGLPLIQSRLLPRCRRWAILLALSIPFAPVALPESQTEFRPEPSKAPVSSDEEVMWTVDLNSLGGIHGQGGGGAHITSQGIVFASPVSVLSPRHAPCRSQLSREELQKIAKAVSSAKPSAWKSSYVPRGDDGCCDRFHWTLLLYQHAPDGAGHTYGTDWYDGNEKRLPDDLASLRTTILSIKNTVLKACEQ